MRHKGWMAGILLVVACSPGRAFNNDIDPTPTISEAERLIADARQAGADSLASEAIAAAGQALESARSYAQSGAKARAQVDAVRAQAEARYARAVAGRELAQREQTRARDALAAVPPGGSR